MKIYEVEVVTKITIHGIDEQDAEDRAVTWVKERTLADEAAWLSCKWKEEGENKWKLRSEI